MIMSLINWLFENYGITTAGLSTAVGIFFFLKKWIKNAIRSFHLSDNFYTIFGDSPAEQIRGDQELHRFAKDLLEIRLSISEQWLKIGVYICDKDGSCTWTNEHINNTFGLDSQDMLGYGWLSSIESSERKRVNDEWVYAIKNKIPYDSEYKVVNLRDNLIISIKTKALAVVDQDDNVKCYIGYLRENHRAPILKTRNEKKKTEEDT